MSRDEQPPTDPPNGPLADSYPNLGDKIVKVKVAGPQPMLFGIVYPVSRVCPNCGGKGHKKVDPKMLFSFTYDRVCKQCGTRYTPPMPRWGGVAFCALGVVGLLMLLGVTAWLYHHGVGKWPVYWVVLVWATSFWITCAAILFGIWSIKRGPGISLPAAGADGEWNAASTPPVSECKTGSGSERITPAGPYSDREPLNRRGPHDDDADEGTRIDADS